jgi:hypothetical protein
LTRLKTFITKELEWMRSNPRQGQPNPKAARTLLWWNQRKQNLDEQRLVNEIEKPPGGKVAELKKVNKRYDEIILKGFDYTFKRVLDWVLSGKWGGENYFLNMWGLEPP